MAVTPLARLKASENGKREILRKVAEEAGTVHLEGFEEEKGFGSPGVKGAHGRNIGEDEGGALKVREFRRVFCLFVYCVLDDEIFRRSYF